MKRDFYFVKSYDGKNSKLYRNYQSAVNYCAKLIEKDIYCGIYVFNFETQNMDCIIGC